MNCTKLDREIGKFLSQKSVGEPDKIRWTAKIGPCKQEVKKKMNCCKNRFKTK